MAKGRGEKERGRGMTWDGLMQRLTGLCVVASWPWRFRFQSESVQFLCAFDGRANEAVKRKRMPISDAAAIACH